ncbi:MAG: prenyltransferase/squalene oxidase repeat-containing protein [Solirubrobacterales bacterium]
MNTPRSSSPRRPLRALCVLGLNLVALAALAGNAGAHVSPAQADHAAERGVNWFLSNQEESGSFGFGGDWAMTALAATGLNAADAQTTLADPSAQEFYLGDWQASGPGTTATDAERAILSGVAGGIQTSRLSTSVLDTTTSNLVARVAELFDGEQIGEPGLLNDDIFGVLALHHAGAPPELLRSIVEYLRTQQKPNGGWTWNASPGAPADTDMTGSAVAAFCAAGVGPGDADLDEAIALLHTLQDPATGGFIAPPEAFGIGVNTDTTSWVTSGLIQCGIDPQGAEWTTSQGKTPLDYLVSMQRPDGHFDWTGEFAGGAFETYSSVRPLAGEAFSAAPPARLDGISPAVRPAANVADGTPVPITLVIDHGPGADDVRMCRVDVESGSSLGAVLADAETMSVPAGCVASFSGGEGPGGLVSLNGVAETTDYEWRTAVNGSAATAGSGDAIGFGDLVFLELAAKVVNPAQPPKVDVPPLGAAAKQRRAKGPRVAVRGRAWLRADGELAVRLECPRGNGQVGCQGVLTVRFRQGRNDRLRFGGSTAFALPSGDSSVFSAAATEALLRSADEGRVRLRVTAATRAEDGALRLTHARRFLSP